MKKLLLIPALILSSLSLAEDYKYEVTPVIGYNIAEGNLKLDNQLLYGVEVQYNSDKCIKPELSVLYTDADFEDSSKSTDIYRIMLNGVYEFDKVGYIKPLVKAGLGYETIDDYYAQNRDSVFFDAGVGIKVPFNDAVAFKLEALYMLKNNNNRWDNNLALLVGLNLAFGQKAQPTPPVVPIIPIDGDDDEDGVLNSKDECPLTRPDVKVNTKGCYIDGDDDNDGVLNSMDECPTTPAGKKVNEKGCYIDGDDDSDGVLNSMDKCPTTPIGNIVNSDGCTKIVNLNINFETASYSVDAISKQNIQKFTNFLKDRKEFDAQIIGHTDNVGTNADNQTLSQKRADTVRDIIIEVGGLDSSRVSSIGMSENSPTATNKTADGRAKNRRIEAVLNKR